MNEDKQPADPVREAALRVVAGIRASVEYPLDPFGNDCEKVALAYLALAAKPVEPEHMSGMHSAIRKVLRHHGLTKVGDGVVESDLIEAVLGAQPTPEPAAFKNKASRPVPEPATCPEPLLSRTAFDKFAAARTDLAGGTAYPEIDQR